MRRKELHELGAAELQKRLSELRLELSKMRAQVAIGASPQNPGKIRQIKKDIARILTKQNLQRVKNTDRNM